MIRTLEGRVGSGKTTRVLAEVAGYAAAGGRALLIVPEQMTLSAELQLAAKLNAPGFLTAEVLSPTGLMRRVNEAAGGLAGRVVIDERGRAMALRAALFELDSSLQVYRGCGGRAGFIEWLADIMGECSQSEIGPTELRLAADALEDGLTRRKLYDLAAIADRYLDVLEGRFLDTSEAVELFLHNVRRVDFLRDARCWVDGFDIMPPRTLRLITGLAFAAREVTVALTLSPPDERGGGLFDPVEQSLARLTNLAADVGMEITREALPRDAYHSWEIGHLEREWDAHPVIEYEAEPRDIELVASPTVREMCEAAAAAMVALNRDHGIPFGDIACALGDEAGCAPLMRRALLRRGVPCFIAQPLTAAEHPAARYWLAAMEAATTGFRDGAMGNVLRSGWSGAGEDAADLLCNRMVERGLRGRAWERAIEGGEALEAARSAVLTPLLNYARRARGATVREAARAAYLLLEEANVYPRLMAAIEECEARGEGVVADRHAQVWNHMLEALDQAVELLGDKTLPHAEFLLALKAGLEGAQLSALPPRPDQVMVTSVARVKGAGIQALFLLGLNADVLPAASASEGLLGGDERALVNGACERAGTPVRLRDPAERDQAEMFSIYSALTLPTHKLYLGYALSGEDGAAMRRSPLVARLKTIFPRLISKSAPRSAKESGSAALWEAARAVRSGKTDEEQLAAWHYFLSSPEYADETGAALRAMSSAGGGESIEREVAEQLFGNRGVAVTRIERFAQCPFLHFVQNGLRPRELYPPGVRPIDAGTLYHAVLDEVVGEIAGQGIPWELADGRMLDRLVDRAAEPLMEEMAKINDGGRFRTRCAELLRTLRKTARVVAYQLRGSLFAPVGHELPFGLDKPYPPLALTLADGTVAAVEGRIDRVDIYSHSAGTFLRVIDYKSGDARLNPRAIADGTSLQLPLYSLVAERALGGETAGFFYCKIADDVLDITGEPQEDAARRAARGRKLNGLLLADPGVALAMDAELSAGERIPAKLKKDGSFYATSSVLPREQMRETLEGAQATAEALVSRMLTGEVAPRPADPSKTCEACAFASVCGHEA